MKLHRWAAALVAPLSVAGLLVSAANPAEARELSFDERVAAQKAIEQVYWNHRIWPKENPGPKPPLSAAMSDRAIRAKVENYLRKSNALETWWQRPVAAVQLQAELDRMAASSRDGVTLEELYRALGNDPYVIAETLARQTLVERLIRNWYASDTRFHGAVRAKAEAALATCASVDCMRSLGGTYREITSSVQELDARTASLPMRHLSELEETSEDFNAVAVLAQRDGEAVTASVTWPKRTFDDWWSASRGAVGSEVELPAGSYMLAAAPTSACTLDTWAPTRSTVPDARNGHTAVWTGTEMIVWGGNNAVGTSSGGRYNPATDTWTPTSTGANLPAARQLSSAVWTGTEMIIWGGTTNASGFSNTGGRYNPATDSWAPTSTGSFVPAARYRHTTVWTGTQMIVWGGRNNSTFFNTGGRYSPSSNSWAPTSTGADVPAARNEHTAVWTGTDMIVWGGRAGSLYFDTGGLYSPSTDSWTATSTEPGVPAAREVHTAVWTGTEMIVWGGSSPSDSNTGGRYDPSNDTWTATSIGSNVPSGRHWHKAVWTGSEMILWGGYNSVFLNTGGRYTPSTDSWTPTSTGTNVPSERSNHSAVWTGTEMIIWAGINGHNFNTGGRYKPSTDSWTPTARETDVPLARTYHSGVWTGSEMIVWGGENAISSYLGNGGRYLPATDSWVPTSMGPNAPSPRYFHSAVWTGTDMVVWGGSNGASYLDTGGRYDPSTDSWSRTSTGPNLPAARLRHTAVWTGTEMIVWGGVSFDGTYLFLNTGGRYKPSTDSWTATTGTNAPSGRYVHSAVWTGKEMIVWGGRDGSAVFSTGARYDPGNDAWTTTSTGLGVPLARESHTSVWTGSDMIVWGGSNGASTDGVTTGGRYSPATDSWTATTTTNVPPRRLNHTAVWTGTEMIVWGGFNEASLYLNTGSRYNPATDGWTATSIGPFFPSSRREQAAVWTGTQMIVWGGTPWTSSGASYCACPGGRLVYRDADGDGYGDRALWISSCDGSIPAGYTADATDCDDHVFIPVQSDSDADGEGDACDLNDGLIWEWRDDKESVSWQAEQGPTSWNVYIGDLGVLRTKGEYTQDPGSNPIAGRHCGITATVVSDPGAPAAGTVAFSLVTGVTGEIEGSLGSSTSGPRPNAHPCP